MLTEPQSHTNGREALAFEIEPFVPRRRLSNAHLQTLAGNFLPRVSLLPSGEERLISVEEVAEGIHARIRCVCHWQRHRRSSLTLIIVHGLEGSSDSQYVIGVGSKAWRLGMNVVRMNMRNCGGTETLAPTLYHSGMSADVGAVAHTLCSEEGLERVALVGYSMGGNLVNKLAGDWGGNYPSEVKAIATVSPAMDLGPSVDALHAPSNRVYEWKFLRGLRRRFYRKSKLFPEYFPLRGIGPLRSIRDFDHEITARFCGFASADDYYARASSARVADRIALPALLVHADDDPFIRLTPETRAKLAANPNVRLIVTRHGGHCAFLAAPNGYDGYWAERVILQFLRQF